VITERLDLFRQVCSAVTFAHQRLIVHRDIKPANIIVTNDGVPKLLDFGIAKLIDEDEKSLTKTGMRLMTPEYASPEQAQGLQITTLSDIYSLGVVLYEMLTGQLPYSFENRSVLEIAKLISTEEPIKPSERTVETRQIEQKDTDKGQKIKRQTLPNSKTLKGDLDNIVLMAMRKEPEKRYASVGQFSEDIRRHLAGLPVIARPLDWKEKFAKFISRNKAATALTAIVFLTLLGGIMATTWQSIRANQQKELAEKRFGEIRKFARTVLFDYHDSIKDLPGSTPVRERLVRDALQYLDALANESNNDASLQLELATAFERVGDVQGGTLLANLGDTAGAIESYRKALNVLQTPPISNLQTNEVLFVKAQCAKKIGALLWETGEMKAALEESEKSRDMFGELVKNNPNEFNYRYEYVSTFDRIGQIQQEQNNLESAKENYAKYLDLLNGFSAEEKASEKVQRQFSIGYEHLGGLYLQNGEFEKALTENTRALEIRRNLAEKNPLNADFQRVYAVSFYNQGEIQRNLSRFAEAQESYQKYLEISQNLLAKDPNNEQYRGDTAYGLIRIGDMQLELGKPEQALLNYQKSQKMRVEDVQKDEANLWKRSSLIESHSKISKAFSKMNQTNSAENEIKQTLDLMDKTEVKPDNALFRSFFAETYFELGEAYSNLKLTKLSCEMYQKSNEILQDMTNRKIMTKADDERFEKISKALRSCE
jgi:non-specific serine/threonine protein kinase/serine/threonine-protein kinase